MNNQKPMILIVDDKPANIHILAEALGSQYDITVATSGKLALELIGRANKPDLILLDIIMPEMDGYEVCNRIKENDATKDIPVIFVTARNAPSDEEHGFNLGVVDYISKPYNLPIVLARVRNHLKLKLKSDMLESLAMLDGLTGIPNRRRFDEIIGMEWRRAVRSGRSLSLVMMDIDFFKQYNDNYGHGAGDNCLIKVASALARCLSRPGDLVARYGGEEFIALLPLTDEAGAFTIAKRFLSEIDSLMIPHAYSEAAGYVTISAGCASIIPTRTTSHKLLLQSADTLLYEAKKNGRNRVCSQSIASMR